MRSVVAQTSMRLLDLLQHLAGQPSASEQQILAKALSEATAVLNSTLELNKVLEHILIQVHRVIPQGTAARIILTETGITRIIRYNSTSGTSETAVGTLTSGHDTMVARRMVKTGEPVAIADT